MVFSNLSTPDTLREFARKEIRNAILRGRLKPGEPVNQVTLSKELGVSRGPLREALNLLEKEGLIVSVPYKGTFVADFNERIIQDTYSLRRVLEPFAVELAMTRSTLADIAELRTIYEEMSAAIEAGNVEAVHELDLAFHRQIYVMADHELLLHIWTSIEANVVRSIFYGNFQNQSRDDTPERMQATHRAILETIESGDIELAKREIGDQLQRAEARLTTQWRIQANQKRE